MHGLKPGDLCVIHANKDGIAVAIEHVKSCGDYPEGTLTDPRTCRIIPNIPE